MAVNLRRSSPLPRPETYTARAGIALELHLRVDSILKALKIHSRRINTGITLHNDELSVLERLYYKGKNQHRASLFWRTIIETRRHCYRLRELSLTELVDTLRGAFYGLGHEQQSSQKMLKAAWTHIPDRMYFMSLQDRLTAATALLQKMQDVCQKSYKSLTLAMQSGAFAQLILTLVAAISRISQAISECLEACGSIQTIVKSILDVLDQSIKMGLSPPIPHSVSLVPVQTANDIRSMVLPTAIQPIIIEKTPKSSHSGADSQEKAPSALVSGAATGNTKERKRKKPKKVNEIDQIFGF